MTIESAALETTTGGYVKPYGYDSVEIVGKPDGTPGKYTSVHALFLKVRSVLMDSINDQFVVELRRQAMQGESVLTMFNYLKSQLEPNNSIVSIINYFRVSFFLSLAEVKPIAALTRTEGREVVDEDRLNELLHPAIAMHRKQWDQS